MIYNPQKGASVLIDPINEVYITLKKGVPDFILKPTVTGGQFLGYLLQSRSSQYGVQPVYAHQLMSSMMGKGKVKAASADAQIMEQINTVRALKPPAEAPPHTDTAHKKRTATSPAASPLKFPRKEVGHGLVVPAASEVLTPKIPTIPSAAAETPVEKSPLDENSQDPPHICATGVGDCREMC